MPSTEARTNTLEITPAARRIAVLASVLGSFLTPFMISAVNVALPTIGRELGLDAVLLNWVPTAFLLASSVFLLPFGRLADLWGRKAVYQWGIALFSAASLLLGLVSGPLGLVALRAVQGMACGMIFSTGPAILASIFGPGERGRVLGINVAAVYCGLSAGPFLGGVLTVQFGWRGLFLAPVPLGALTLLLLWRGLPQEWRAPGPPLPFDRGGTLLYAAGLVTLIVSLSFLPGPAGWGLLLAGLAGLAVFLWWETRVPAPLLPVALFRDNRVFAFANLASLIHYAATYANSFLLSLFLQKARGLAPREAGTVLVAQPLVQALCSPVAGWLSDRWDPRFLASGGMGLTMTGLALLASCTPETSLVLLVLVLCLMGFGFALFSSPNINCVMGSVAPRDYGLASGTQSTMRVLGQLTSMAVTMLLFAVLIGAVEIDAGRLPVFLQAFRMAYLIFAVLCAFGILASLARGPGHGDPARRGADEWPGTLSDATPASPPSSSTGNAPEPATSSGDGDE